MIDSSVELDEGVDVEIGVVVDWSAVVELVVVGLVIIGDFHALVGNVKSDVKAASVSVESE